MAGSVQRQKVYVQVTESRSCACWRRQGLTLMWETAYPTSNAAMALTPGSTHRIRSRTREPLHVGSWVAPRFLDNSSGSALSQECWMQRPAGTGVAAPTGRDTVRERGPLLGVEY